MSKGFIFSAESLFALIVLATAFLVIFVYLPKTDVTIENILLIKLENTRAMKIYSNNISSIVNNSKDKFCNTYDLNICDNSLPPNCGIESKTICQEGFK
ncbi:MAG: hypothetical protein PHQ98_00400 [Candidatus ainarchaeum sp.]|nr:hypothetical protein [Candidatus ainarchaeum sp.]